MHRASGSAAKNKCGRLRWCEYRDEYAWNSSNAAEKCFSGNQFEGICINRMALKICIKIFGGDLHKWAGRSGNVRSAAAFLRRAPQSRRFVYWNREKSWIALTAILCRPITIITCNGPEIRLAVAALLLFIFPFLMHSRRFVAEMTKFSSRLIGRFAL